MMFLLLLLVCLHGEFSLVLAYLSTLKIVFTPSLAGGMRGGAWLAGRQQSPGEQGDEGRQRETSAYSIRKAAGGDSTHYFQPATEQLTAGSDRQIAWLPGISTTGWKT